jgi:hypothetical protein
VIAVLTPTSWSSRVGPGIARTTAQIERNIRQSTAKSQVSIMYFNSVWGTVFINPPDPHQDSHGISLKKVPYNSLLFLYSFHFLFTESE